MSYIKVTDLRKSQSDTIKLADPLAVFQARAQAHASLVASCDYDLIESVDTLWAAAVRANLVSEIGTDRIQEIMARAFAPIHSVEKPSHSADIANVTLCEESDAARGPAPAADAPYRLVARDGVASAAELQRIYERAMAADRARYGPATSVVKLADSLVAVGDAARLEAWLADRSASDRAAIVAHIDKKRRGSSESDPRD